MGSSVAYIRGNKVKETKTSKVTTTGYFEIHPPVPTALEKSLNDTSVKEGRVSTVRNHLNGSGLTYATNKQIDVNMPINEIVGKMNNTLHLPSEYNGTDTVQKSFVKTVKYYNRFKAANPNAYLQKGFAHVFFVKPCCNILTSSNKLVDALRSNETFAYAYNNCREILSELSELGGSNTHDFMMSLSNFASSFSLNDEYINSDTYGTTYTGYKIAYGKNNIESKTAGTFSVSFNDDRSLHIYQLHKTWIEYINGVYRGSITPSQKTIMNKILDYAGAVYYILTAEDGETILFWSKYYGVFPTNIPSGQYSWAAGNVISNPQLDITYQFSFKEDFNPYSIIEFNANANVGSNPKYIPVYDAKLGHAGETWVGTPFIELVKNNNADCPYVYKLRFTQRK